MKDFLLLFLLLQNCIADNENDHCIAIWKLDEQPTV